MPQPALPPDLDWRDRKRAALRDEDYVLRLSVALVRRMDALSRERGITFVVAVFPNQSSYRAKQYLAGRFVESLRRDGIPVIDMAARFRKLGLRFDDFALDWMGHLSPRGHAVVSRVIEAEIKSRVA